MKRISIRLVEHHSALFFAGFFARYLFRNRGMGKLIWNRGDAASPSLAVSYVLGSGGCGGIGTAAANRQNEVRQR